MTVNELRALLDAWDKEGDGTREVVIEIAELLLAVRTVKLLVLDIPPGGIVIALEADTSENDGTEQTARISP